jgi:transposase InsO family protein
MSLNELTALKRYLADNLSKGFIVPSDAPYTSPVLFVKKKDQSLRFCIDYRKLNSITRKDGYPLPLIDETLQEISKAKVMTKLDIRQAFHRIRMAEGSEDLTTFRTRYGSYKCKVLPFGLTNGPATFQRYMNEVLFEFLDDFCTVFMDDILIYSANEEEHQQHVRKVLRRLREAGLTADIRKCEFHVTQTRFLGFIVSTNGIAPDPAKISVMASWGRPNTVRGVLSFLGVCNFYRRFVKNYGRIARPLQKLTRKNIPFRWTAKCEAAFEKLKTAMVTAPVLMYYDPTLKTRIETDASDGVVAGQMLQLFPDGEWHPIAYYSCAMDEHEMNYDIHDKEMLAVITALREWRSELVCLPEPFLIVTDHKALEYFQVKRTLNARQARWCDVLADYHYRITYRPGKLNAVADGLSRKAEELATQKEIRDAARIQQLIPDSAILLFPDSTDMDLCIVPMEKPQGHELIDRILTLNRTPALSPSLDTLRRKATNSLSPPAEPEGDVTPRENWKLSEQGLLTNRGALVVPEEENLRTRLLEEIHTSKTTAHPGRNKMRRMLQGKYYWPRMTEEIARYTNNCHECKRARPPNDKTPGLLKPLEVPDHPWQHITMDFKSFPKDKKGYDMVFAVVDRLGKRAVTIPCYATITAEESARIYYERIFPIFGLPESIVSDRGPQFVSAFWDEVCKIVGIRKKLSTAYHPQTDGQTEAWNRVLDQSLRYFINHYQNNWSDLLPVMDYAHATTPHTTTGLSPFEVEFGRRARTQFDWEMSKTDGMPPREKMSRDEGQAWIARIRDAWQTARASMTQAQQAYKKQADKHRRSEDFEVGDEVFVKKTGWITDRPSLKLDNPMAGPYRILEKKGHSYKLDLPASIKVHPVFPPDRLRKAPKDPLPGQKIAPPPPEVVNGENEWEVEKVLASRIYYGRLQYQVAWRGWDPDPTFYDAENFKNATSTLKTYHKENPATPGPPMMLDAWIAAEEKGLQLESDKRDNRAINEATPKKILRRRK